MATASTELPNPSRLSVRQLTKSFPGVRALSGVDLDVRAGEVVAVIGENGAGKSTLMKILAGVQTQDEGEILWDGHPVWFANTRQAMKQGLGLIHQELNLCDNLNVAENLFLGNYPGRGGWINFWSMYRRARQSLEKVGLKVSPRLPLSALSLGQQQMVEIAKALSIDAKVLIFDEPTSSLSNAEAEALFRLIEELKSRGVAIVYISHRLAEIMRLADRVFVLRDGQNAGMLQRAEITHDRMVQLMIGRDVSKYYVRRSNVVGDEVLRVEDLRTNAWPQHSIRFQVRRGELVGIAGLVGAGRSELLRTIFGIDRAVSGNVVVSGESLKRHSPQLAMEAGLGFVPEDRKKEGLILESTIVRNVGLAGLLRNAHWGGWLNRGKEIADTRQAMNDMRIKTPSPWQLVKYLSGGNQQKVVMGKWLALSPQVLLMDEPTRGVDIGAKQEIYQLMEGLAAEGRGVLFASSELEEIIGIADRVLVMHEGRLAGEVSGDQITEQAIMQLAIGGSL
ncbi:MAG: sugar ABC transporter ATP-binding protein [Planctomycetaceae bacterium]|nr:sugar ABC transporter ATP-binding protein [Planctomycetaceae bacterium]